VSVTAFKDLAGNAGTINTASADNVVIDTRNPDAPSTPDLDPVFDTGQSSTDNITGLTVLKFNGTAESGSTVKLYSGMTLIGSAVATNGSYSITTITLAGGMHSITATATDVAGNVSVASAPLSVTIDTTAPSAPSAPDLVAASDSGTLSNDNITNATTPTFTGTADIGTTIQLMSGNQVIGTGATDALGKWTITASAPLVNGTYDITTVATNVIGNSTSSVAPLTVNIDTQKPEVASIVLADANLTIGETTLVTITFTEKVVGFTRNDVVLSDPSSGTLGAFSSSDGGLTWTATFQPASDVSDGTNNSFSVKTGLDAGWSDLAGNGPNSAGVQSQSANYTVNTNKFGFALNTNSAVESNNGATIPQGAVLGSFSNSATGWVVNVMANDNFEIVNVSGVYQLRTKVQISSGQSDTSAASFTIVVNNTHPVFGVVPQTYQITIGNNGQNAITVTTTETISDIVFGLGNRDTIRAGVGDDFIHGGSDNDYIYGEGGNDFLFGAGANDSLQGGAGADTLMGGTGADKFIFARGDSTAAALDTISDFKSSEQDIIDLSLISPNLSFQQLTPITSASQLAANKVAYMSDGSGNLLVYVDLDGVAGFNSATDMVIKLTGVASVSSSDFQFAPA
jgi:Ca2+-binding RTX toxin-like protein